MVRFELPLDVKTAPSPADFLHTNRRTVISQFLVFGPVFGLLFTLGYWLIFDLFQGLLDSSEVGLADAAVTGVGVALGDGLGCVFSLTAWGQWAVLARIWLPLTGKLPWSVLAFLDDAHQRGVLRQAGAIYQFRHSRLQDYLARAVQTRRD
jgi:hypothetical protein